MILRKKLLQLPNHQMKQNFLTSLSCHSLSAGVPYLVSTVFFRNQ